MIVGKKLIAGLLAALLMPPMFCFFSSCHSSAGGKGVVTVRVGGPFTPISPLIYGMASPPETMLIELGVTLNRFGGNPSSRYNWKLANAWNAGKDWFFENLDYTGGDKEPADRALIRVSRKAGAATLLNLPLLEYVAKDRTSHSFSVRRYGPQQAADPNRPDAGNGLQADGTPISGNDPTDASLKIDESFAVAWLDQLGGGVDIVALGNEPMLWDKTHRDVHPVPATYDEVLEKVLRWARALKKEHPAVQIAAPGLWGWPAYFGSAKDRETTGADKRAHEGKDFIPWFLERMRKEEQLNGKRLLDYLDVHYYPQAEGVYSDRGDPATSRLRLRSVRSLDDEKYQDESWIERKVALIPRMKGWIEEHYPGTGLLLSEYNFGGAGHISGALAQAVALGVMAREGLDAACLWTYPPEGSPQAEAFRLYRNYDGAGARFGDRLVPSSSSSDGLFSVAALDSEGRLLTVVLVNHAPEAFQPTLLLDGGTAAAVRAFGYAEGDPAVHPLKDRAVLQPDGQSLLVTLGAMSMVLVEVELIP